MDFEQYLSHRSADGDIALPTEAQLQMLRAVVPDSAFRPAPPISDRQFWDGIAASPSGQAWLTKALTQLDEEPEVPISDEIYRRANLEGNRPIYKPRYYRTMERLEYFILAECLQNEGRFLPQIVVYLDAILAMKSWLHPNHDRDDNAVLEGRAIAIDLGARRFGTGLALADVLLEDRLPADTRNQIAQQLQQRIIDSYRTSCAGHGTMLDWYKGTSNWNSVCTSGALFVTTAMSQDPDERLAAVGCALNSMEHYLSGFGQDGYCSEGVGYWRYGFGHYMYLAQVLLDYSGGRIDLLNAGNPAKMSNVGTYPERYEIQKGLCAPFSDGIPDVPGERGFATVMATHYYGARTPPAGDQASIVDDEAAYQLIAWTHPDLFPASDGPDAAETLPGTTYFDEAGIVISRGNQDIPLSIAIKAGHNDENHNHDDVGSYSILLDETFITGDIGRPAYVAGTFAKGYPARSSWGHPVPRIDGALQSNGPAFAGRVTATDFTDIRDRVTLDIKDAYEVAALRSLTRTMENDRSGAGAITIQDQFTAAKPINFGSAIMTFAEFDIIDETSVLLTIDNRKLKADVSSTGGSVRIAAERVPAENLREGDDAYRIGVDFIEPVRQGTITVRYTPVP